MQIQVIAQNKDVAIEWARKYMNAKVNNYVFMRNARRWHDKVFEMDDKVMGDYLGDVQSIFKLDIEGGDFEDIDENALFTPNRTRLKIIEEEINPKKRPCLEVM